MTPNELSEKKISNEEIILPNKNKLFQTSPPESLKKCTTGAKKIEEMKKYQFIIKKKGRKSKLQNFMKENKRNVHDKFSNDNIKRRIKALYNKYIITLLNSIVKRKYKKARMKFLKMNIRITKDIGIKYNQILLNKAIKDIIINVSNKYQNKENNINVIKFIKKQKDNEEILNILNMSYKDLYTEYYLKSTKNNTLENSFESHKEKLLSLNGKEYLDKFIENANHLVEFFMNSKNRKARKFPEIDIINIPIENEKIDTSSNSDEAINDENRKNKNLKINTVSTATQTDIGDINAKIIVFS